MEAVKKGADRQQLHEVIRTYSMEVELARKQGEDISLIDKIKNDPAFRLSEEELKAILKPSDFIVWLLCRQSDSLTRKSNPY
jgi:adenylosuccinate lyase